MSDASEPRFLVLHGLRIKGFTDEHAISRMSGLPAAQVMTQLAGLREEGLAQLRTGRVSGWTLTRAGRSAHAAVAAVNLSDTPSRRAVEVEYQRFLTLNGPLLATCTDWQLRPGDDAASLLANPHDDAVYDASVVNRLRQLHAQAQPVCAALASAVARFSRYGPRLDQALAHVDAGDMEWFVGTHVDSYHAIWFELHEDLLVTLGRARESEMVP